MDCATNSDGWQIDYISTIRNTKRFALNLQWDEINMLEREPLVDS